MDNQDQTPQEDPKVKEAIATILKKDPTDLTAADRAFLRARKSYLGRNARSKFADALSEETPTEEKTETPEKKASEFYNSQHPADVAGQSNNTQASDEDDVE